MQSWWTSTDHFSNSTDSSVTNCWFSRTIDVKRPHHNFNVLCSNAASVWWPINWRSSSRAEGERRGEEMRQSGRLGSSRPGPLSSSMTPRLSQMHHQLIDRTWTLNKETLMLRSHHRSRPLPSLWNCSGLWLEIDVGPPLFTLKQPPKCWQMMPEVAGVINPSSRRRTTPPLIECWRV